MVTSMRRMTARIEGTGTHGPRVRRGVRALWTRNDKRNWLYNWCDAQEETQKEWLLKKEFKRW